MSILRAGSLSLALLIGGVTGSAVATPVMIAVDATTPVRSVDPRWIGANTVIWDTLASSAQTLSLEQAAGIKTIRFPGGSVSDMYHWLYNTSESDSVIGGNNATVNRVLNARTWPSGFDSAMRQIDALGCQAYVTVNYGTGTPEEAAAWVAYANAPSTLLGTPADVTLGTDGDNTNWGTAGKWSALRAAGPLTTDDGSNFLRVSRTAPVGVKYWEVGNKSYDSGETDLQGTQSNISTRSGHPLDPVTYAIRAHDYIVKMKAVDPTIKVGVVVTDTGYLYADWNPTMLSTLKSSGVAPDFVSCCRYPQLIGTESDSGLLSGLDYQGRTWAQVAATLRSQITTAYGSAGANIELVCTDSNSTSMVPTRQSLSLVNGLYLADSVGSLLQTEFNTLIWWAARKGPPTDNYSNAIPDFRASFYGWRNYADYGMISTQMPGGSASNYELYPTYYAMKLLSHFAAGGDTVIKATSNNPLVSVYAAKRTDATVTLLVVNKDPTNDADATVNITGFTPGPATTYAYTYGKAQDLNALTSAGTSDLGGFIMKGSGTTYQGTFTSYSASVVVLPVPVPPAPANLNGFASGTNEVTLTWSAVPNAAVTGYAITRATDSAFRQVEAGFTVGATTSFFDTTVVPNHTYYYNVAAINSSDTGPVSAGVKVTTLGSVGPNPSHLVNISARGNCSAGDNVTIGGYVIAGSAAKTVLVRAVGPSLSNQGLSAAEVLQDPTIEVHDAVHGNAIVATNDNWGDNTNSAQITATAQNVGASALSNSDTTSSALLLTLPPGVYSFVATGKNGTSGVVLVEVYDADTSNTAANFVNISSRANSSTGNNVAIGGFVIGGGALKHVLLRAVGPTLTTQGITQAEVMVDPTIELHDASHGNAVIATNDNWSDNANASAIVSTGGRIGATPFANTDTTSSALLVTLPPGVYSFVARGANNTAGIVLVEIYDAD